MVVVRDLRLKLIAKHEFINYPEQFDLTSFSDLLSFVANNQMRAFEARPKAILQYHPTLLNPTLSLDDVAKR